jgi:Ca-activated chloride channel family protein
MAEMAAEQGIMLYTIGFGSPQGEPIPEYNVMGEIVGYKKDQNGEVVLSFLDEAMLQQIAEAGGGRYFPASANGGELDALVEELDALQKAELASLLEVRGIERFQPFLLAALALMVAIEGIPDRLERRAAKKRAAMHAQWSKASGQ